MDYWPDYLAVAFLGALVGAGELVSRYRDEPTRALLTRQGGMIPALLYVMINSVAGLAALKLIHVFGWNFGGQETQSNTRYTQVLVASFGAMALFRSSFFTLRVGGQDMGVGPSSVLKILLDATDRAVDRRRARGRSGEVSQIMKAVSFAKASEVLPAYCIALMQNLSQEDQRQLGNQVKELGPSTMDDHFKSLLLGLAILNFVGIDVLKAAVDALGERIRDNPQP
ncbi:MAG: hypothetical protein WCB68_16875 [Pyrinomonadaceae bacterium]